METSRKPEDSAENDAEDALSEEDTIDEAIANAMEDGGDEE